jgi:hypothetical protein
VGGPPVTAAGRVSVRSMVLLLDAVHALQAHSSGEGSWPEQREGASKRSRRALERVCVDGACELTDVAHLPPCPRSQSVRVYKGR